MTSRERGFLVVLAFVLILFGYYYFFMQNQLDDIALLDQEIVQNKSKILEVNQATTEKEKLQALKMSYEDDLRGFYNPFLKDIVQEDIILLINEILIRSEVEVASIAFSDFESNVHLTVDFDSMVANMSIKGNYDQVLNLVSSFWRFDHNIYIKNLDLSAGEDDLLTGTIEVGFVRVRNKYASDVTLFQWYNDVYFDKEDPFKDDFSFLFKPNYFYTGSDVGFYNKPFEGFEDVKGHWAEEVLTFFGRNGYLIGDDANNIRPDDPITRLDTVLLLDLVFRWELQEDFVALESFADYEEISALDELEKKALLKAYNSGYILGYEDNTLRPYNNITYEELGFIGDNLIEGLSITWLDVATEIKSLFGYESPGLQDQSLPASRAEIVYFLSFINAKKAE